MKEREDKENEDFFSMHFSCLRVRFRKSFLMMDCLLNKIFSFFSFILHMGANEEYNPVSGVFHLFIFSIVKLSRRGAVGVEKTALAKRINKEKFP